MGQKKPDVWSRPPAQPALAPGVVDVWAIGLDREVLDGHKLASTLTADEHTRADRFRSDKGRAHFIAARGCLRVILAKYLHCQASEIIFAYGKQGKPALAGSEAETGVRFNVSHSEGRALVAIGQDADVGVDIEHQSRQIGQMTRLAGRFFAEGEYTMLLNTPESDRREAFFNCWTRKEAFVKALGAGLAHSLKDFEVSLDRPAKLLSAKGVAVDQWTLAHLDVGDGYIGAVAVGGREIGLRCWAVDCDR